MQHDLRIAIVGAGIAGLTVGAALADAGIRCDIFEQARQLEEVGAGLQLAPSATRVLHRLGLGDYLRTVAVRPEAIEMRRWRDNSMLRRTPLGHACEDAFGSPYYTVHRADLHRGLIELLPNGTVHLGVKCNRVEEGASDVRLRLEDGSVVVADVAIGADGIHSTLRSMLARDRARFSGQSIFRGLVPAERVPNLLEEPRVVLWLGPGRHCVCYPIRAKELITVGATAPVPDWHAESWTSEGMLGDLLGHYDGWNSEVQQLLASLVRVGQWALHDRDPIARWSRSRITIVGDAAHPMLPFLAQGANQAVEDGIALATLLSGARRDEVVNALALYEQLRQHRTYEVHRVSRTNTEMLHLPDGPDQARRDRALSETADLRSQEWLYGYDSEQAAAALVS